MTRVAVVGAGKMGTHHARVFARAVGATLVGVLDVDHARASTVAELHRCDVLRDLDECIERADVVVIATPTGNHDLQVRRVLGAGRHVLVEKPLCTDGARARALCELAKARGASLFVGHSERFNPVVRAIARAVSRETIVSMTTIRTLPSTQEEPCLNLAVHDVDLAAFLTTERVHLRAASAAGELTDLVLTAGRVLVRVSVGRSATPARAIRVETTLARYEGDLLAQRATREGLDLALEREEPLRLQADAMLAALRGQSSAVASGAAGADAVVLANHAVEAVNDARVSAAE